MFKKLLEKVKRIKKVVVDELKYIDCKNFDESFYDFIFDLVNQDIIPEAIEKYKEEIKKLCKDKLKYSEVLNFLRKKVLENYNFKLEDLFKEIEKNKPYVILVVGFNGHGKTTNSAKLAKILQEKFNVLFVCADVFRAAAIEQFEKTCKDFGIKNCLKFNYKTPTKYICKKVNEVKNNYDVVIIDTAGRSYENYNLMKELENLKNCIKPNAILWVVESSIGNDLINQYNQFGKIGKIDYVIFSKFDLYNKEGIILSLLLYSNPKILFLGVGEKEYEEFDVKKFINVM